MHLNPAHQSVKSCVRYLCRAVSTPADIFLVFRTLLNCLKCIIYEDCYRKITQIPIIILTDASSLLCIKKMTSTPVDLPQEFFRINRDIWQALTIKVGASFLTLFQEQLT